MNAWRVAAGLILVALGVIFTLNNLIALFFLDTAPCPMLSSPLIESSCVEGEQ